jgi:23S rRNA pseudouridine2605 synthase
MRLNKFLQQAGVGSRREAERLIEDGLVQVDGILAKVTTEVHEGARVTINGQPLAISTAPQPRIFKYHKPIGVIVTARDHAGRETLYAALEKLPEYKKLPRLMPVGRLDLNSEGLLLLTDSGALAQTLMSPQTALPRHYRVRAHGRLTEAQMVQWRQGLTIEGIKYRGAKIEMEKQSESGQNCWYAITITEGKNRELRKIFEHFGCAVNRLVRVGYGPFLLNDLPARAIKEIPSAEVAAFVKTLPNNE